MYHGGRCTPKWKLHKWSTWNDVQKPQDSVYARQWQRCSRCNLVRERFMS